MIGRTMIFIMIALLAGCNGDTSQKLKGFSTYLENIGYSFYNPPRTDRGPTSVFRFTKSESGKTIISPVCSKLFQHIPINVANLSIPSEYSTEEIQVDFAVSLISDLLSDAPKLGMEFGTNSVIDVHFGNVRSVYINEEDLYNKDGNSHTITPSCFAALNRLASQGELKNNVFVVQESLQVDSMSYAAKKTNSSGADANFPIKNLVKFKPEINYSFNSDNTLLIKEPRYVAFRAFLLNDYINTGLTSAGTAVIKAEPLNLSDIKKRLSN